MFLFYFSDARGTDSSGEDDSDDDEQNGNGSEEVIMIVNRKDFRSTYLRPKSCHSIKQKKNVSVRLVWNMVANG